MQGGMQLSIDMRQAFDRLPRAQLEISLRRISVPDDLISLIMYLHFEMLLVALGCVRQICDVLRSYDRHA